ncbi:MAG: prolyl oligopeptidase family serine peptidase [bacterium]|nr:prolyl oligopeptidase family serine peptidase [bacterium]
MAREHTTEDWRAKWIDMLGPFPETVPALDVRMRRVEDYTDRAPDSADIECYHVSFQVGTAEGPNAGLLNRVTAYLLVPEAARAAAPAPAVLCIHSTTQGSGKSRIAGLCGVKPGDPPDTPPTSRAYGLELARWGYVTLSIDLICDGERIAEGGHQHDTSWFYTQHPKWSAVGKNLWDSMRAVDFLHTLDFVDPHRIGCVGHSLGGHSTLFATAFDDRIACGVTNCGVLSWDRSRDHWSRPANRKDGVSGYVYIPRFRPYIEDQSLAAPIDFEHLMMMAAPRPLLVQCSEGEAERDDTCAKTSLAGAVYRAQNAGDRLGLFTFPGKHNYPPVAKRYSFAWLDRWLRHTPAVPTIWPEAAV